MPKTRNTIKGNEKVKAVSLLEGNVYKRNRGISMVIKPTSTTIIVAK